MSDNDPIKVYTVPELVKLLKLTPQSVRKYLVEGKLKGRKVGTKWLVTDEAVREFLRGDS
jgi:excisionase family DNA binding protein